MNYNFEYIDIILLAMIAGFIFLKIKRNFEEKDLVLRSKQHHNSRKYLKNIDPAIKTGQKHILTRMLKKNLLKVQRLLMKP